MTDAFICDRCGETNEGYGVQARVGEYKGRLNNSFASKYSFVINDELCEGCYEGLVDVAEEYMEDETDG